MSRPRKAPSFGLKTGATTPRSSPTARRTGAGAKVVPFQLPQERQVSAGSWPQESSISPSHHEVERFVSRLRARARTVRSWAGARHAPRAAHSKRHVPRILEKQEPCAGQRLPCLPLGLGPTSGRSGRRKKVAPLHRLPRPAAANQARGERGRMRVSRISPFWPNDSHATFHRPSSCEPARRSIARRQGLLRCRRLYPIRPPPRAAAPPLIPLILAAPRPRLHPHASPSPHPDTTHAAQPVPKSYDDRPWLYVGIPGSPAPWLHVVAKARTCTIYLHIYSHMRRLDALRPRS